MNTLHQLSATLKSISTACKDFQAEGLNFVNSTKNLSAKCSTIQNPKLPSILGPEVASTLNTLAHVLSHVGEAQTQLFDSLNASLTMAFSEFADQELALGTKLNNEYYSKEADEDTALEKYLHGDVVGVGSAVQGAVAAGSGALRNFGSNLKKWGARKNSESALSVPTANAVVVVEENLKENLKVPQTVKQTAQIKLNLETVKLKKTEAELARFNLLQYFEALKNRKNFEIGEKALASLYGFKAFFGQCSDVSYLSGVLAEIQNKQELERTKFKAHQEPWEGRKENLHRKITEVEAAVTVSTTFLSALSCGDALATGMLEVKNCKKLEEVEKESGVWSINDEMNEMAIYERTKTKGVYIEGFLYKKSTGALSMSTWNKRWFILDKDGLHYLRGGVIKSHAHGVGGNENLEMVKVADTLLTTVKEVRPDLMFNEEGNFKNPGNHNLRWSFEIISATNRPYTLQAAGPLQHANWLTAIRKGIERQLTQSVPTPTPKKNYDFVFVEGGEQAPNKVTFDDNVVGSGVKHLQSSNSVVENSDSGSGSSNSNSNSSSSSSSIKFYNSSNDAEGALFAAGNATPVLRRFASNISEINKRLDAGMVVSSLDLGEGDGEDVKGEAYTPSPRSRSIEVSPRALEILKLNPSCVDCGEGTSPDWVCLKFGVIFCQECCGVHRQLGTHVSVCRSLTLDALSNVEFDLILRRGNERMNHITECSMQAGWKKLEVDSSREERLKYVQSKYEYLAFCTEQNVETACEDLIIGVVEKDLVKVHKAILGGASVTEELIAGVEDDEAIVALMKFYIRR